MPSKTGSPVTVARMTPASANVRPVIAALSSTSRTGSSGLRERRMKASQLLFPRNGVAWRTAVRSAKPSKIIATTRITIAIAGESISSGWLILCQPS